jgi:hypothetical protein
MCEFQRRSALGFITRTETAAQFQPCATTQSACEASLFEVIVEGLASAFGRAGDGFTRVHGFLLTEPDVNNSHKVSSIGSSVKSGRFTIS